MHELSSAYRVNDRLSLAVHGMAPSACQMRSLTMTVFVWEMTAL
jgi:hypothetical protein